MSICCGDVPVWAQLLEAPELDVGSPGVGGAGGCELPHVAAGTEFGCPVRVICAPNRCATSPAPYRQVSEESNK